MIKCNRASVASEKIIGKVRARLCKCVHNLIFLFSLNIPTRFCQDAGCFHTLKNGVALLKPHLNVAIFNPLKCVLIKHVDVAFYVEPHQCAYTVWPMHSGIPVWRCMFAVNEASKALSCNKIFQGVCWGVYSYGVAIYLSQIPQNVLMDSLDSDGETVLINQSIKFNSGKIAHITTLYLY